MATYLTTIGIGVSAAKLTDWLALIPVVALELGAALSMLLVQSVSSSAAGTVQGGQQTAPQDQQAVDSPSDRPVDQPQPASSVVLDSRKAVTRPDPVSKPSVQKRPGKRRLGQAGNVTRAAAEARIVDTLKNQGGKLDDASVRGVAKLIGGRKSTVHSALAALAAAGVIARVGSSLVLHT